MPGNIDVPTFDASNPLIPEGAKEIRDLIDGLANAKIQILRSDQVGDLGAYAFRYQGGFVILALPFKSAVALPGISAQPAAAFDVEKVLTVSATPTQDEVTAIRDYARSIGRFVSALTGVLKSNTFPS
jgi:hypothetical protein